MESTSANTSAAFTAPLFGPGLGDTQRSILLLLKRLGPVTQAEVGRHLPFAPATLREHLRTLTAHGLVERQGSRRGKRGRPEVVYALTRRGDALFPHGEAAVLRDLVVQLAEDGHLQLLERFLARRTHPPDLPLSDPRPGRRHPGAVPLRAGVDRRAARTSARAYRVPPRRAGLVPVSRGGRRSPTLDREFRGWRP